MAKGGLLTKETPFGCEFLFLKPDFFKNWVIQTHQTYVIMGTHTGISKWLNDHGQFSVLTPERELCMQLSKHTDSVGKQLAKAYGGFALGGTPLGAVTGAANVAALGSTAAHSAVSPSLVVGSEVGQMIYDQGTSKATGTIARGMDRLGMRDTYTLYLTALQFHQPARYQPKACVKLRGNSTKHLFKNINSYFLQLKC